MSEASQAAGSPPLPKQDPEALVLRGTPRPTIRFRRGLIVAVTGAVGAIFVTVSWLALQPPGVHRRVFAPDSIEPARPSLDDALAKAPAGYDDVPRLGPPLPGDLGRPILDHRQALAEAASPSLDMAADAERMQSARAAERERSEAALLAARTSPVIVQLGEGGGRAAGQANAFDAPNAAPGGQPPAQAPAPLADGAQHKSDFAQARSGGETNPHPLQAAPSPWTVSAGTVIPASLITGLNSDLPGMVLAQVTADVRDSATGRVTLIPQGARLIGSYDNDVAYGQRRALLAWTRIVFPDGSSVELDNMPASDPSGYAGLAGEVDTHASQLLKGIALSTLLGIGTELSLGSSESGLVQAIRESAQQNAAHAGDRITSRNLDVQPTLKVRPGWPVRAIVNEDLVLEPWRG